MSRLIIHIGMPKTGTSSIQETLFNLGVLGAYRYADLGVANHGGIITSVFAEDPSAWHGHRVAGSSPKEVERYYQKALASLDTVRNAHGQQIISGEGIWHMSEMALVKLRDYFASHFEYIKIVGYVRPPITFMASSFQQLVKNHGLSKLSVGAHYPPYRGKFEKFDRVFGQENVTLRLFDPKRLVGGDAVVDFCQLLGESISSENIQRVNESLSLEATAVLFAYRREGPLYAAYRSKARDNNNLVKSLVGFGSTKLSFTDLLVAPVLEQHRADIEWIEQRLGQPIIDQGSKDAEAITSEAQLLDVALEQFDALEAHVNKQLEQAEPTPKQLAHWVEKLRTVIASRNSNGQAPVYGSQGFFTEEQMALLEDEKLRPVIALRELALAFERHGQIDEASSVIKAAITLRPDAKGLLVLQQRINSGAEVKVNKSLGREQPGKGGYGKLPPNKLISKDDDKMDSFFFECFQKLLSNNELGGLDFQKINLENLYNEFFQQVEILKYTGEDSDFDKELIELCNLLSSFKFIQDSLASAVKTGSISIELKHGETFLCRHSIKHGSFNYLRFTGKEVFFVFQDNFSAEAVYLPQRGQIIRFKQGRHFERKIKKFLAEIVGDLLKYSCYFANEKSSFAGIFLAHKSPYHYYAFKVAPVLGFAKTLNSECFSVYSEVGKNFLSWQDILPNNISKEVVLDSYSDLKDHALENGLFYFQPGIHISKQYNDLVKAADCYLHGRVSTLCNDYSVVKKAKELRSHCDFFVWLGITTGKREWIEEEPALIEFIERLAERFEKIAIVFDGWTSTLDREGGNESSAPVLYSEDSARVARILEHVPRNISAISLVGETVYSKIAVGSLVDFFVSNHATGSLWVSRICQKPGVTHISNSALNASRRMHIHPQAVEFPPELVTDLPTSENSSLFHVSYSIKSKQFINFSMELIDKLGL